MPLIPVLVDIERAGVLVDCPLLASQSRHLEQELASYTARIYELAREEFNINSPVQLGRILFEKLALPVARKDWQDTIGVNSRRSARGAGARPRATPPGPRLAWTAKAEEHLHRRVAA